MLTLEVNEKEQAPLGQQIRGKDSRISFDDVRTDIPFTLLFFMLLKIFVLVYIKNLHGPAKKSVVTVLPAELTQLPTSATKIS